MKAQNVLTVMLSKIRRGEIDIEDLQGGRAAVESQIRIAAEDDEGFEDCIKELGITRLAKAYEERKGKEVHKDEEMQD